MLSKAKATENDTVPINLEVPVDFKKSLDELSKRHGKTRKSIIIEGVYLWTLRKVKGDGDIG